MLPLQSCKTGRAEVSSKTEPFFPISTELWFLECTTGQLHNCATAQLHNCTAHASAALMWSHFAGSSDGNSTQQHCDILTGELSGQRMCSSRRFFWRISQVAAVGFRREAVGAKNMKSLTIMRGFHRWQWQTCQWPQASGNCGFCGR